MSDLSDTSGSLPPGPQPQNPNRIGNIPAQPALRKVPFVSQPQQGAGDGAFPAQAGQQGGSVYGGSPTQAPYGVPPVQSGMAGRATQQPYGIPPQGSAPAQPAHRGLLSQPSWRENSGLPTYTMPPSQPDTAPQQQPSHTPTQQPPYNSVPAQANPSGPFAQPSGQPSGIAAPPTYPSGPQQSMPGIAAPSAFPPSPQRPLPVAPPEKTAPRGPSRRKVVIATAASSAAVAGAAIAAIAIEENQYTGVVREYWIQANSFQRNLAPSGTNGLTGEKYTADQTTYWAIGYHAYTANWKELLPADDSSTGIGANTGVPGPILRGRVGDTIRVHFRNNDTHYKFPHTLHPHGVLYNPLEDGAWTALNPNKKGANIPVGGTYTYEWTVIPSSVGTWPYHDHAMPTQIGNGSSNSMGGMNMGGMNMSGMSGMNMSGMGSMAMGNMSGMNMNSTKKTATGDAPPPGMPPGTPAGGYTGTMELGAELGLLGMFVLTDGNTPQVDKEIHLFIHDLHQEDIPSLPQDFDCLNGLAFLGNTPTFRVKVGQRVRWHIMALTKLPDDFNVFHLDGHRWLYKGRYVDSVIIGSAMTITFDYVEDNPGTWIYSSHVTDHMQNGMSGYYIVEP